MLVQPINNNQTNTSFGFKIKFNNPELKERILKDTFDLERLEKIFDRAEAYHPSQIVKFGYDDTSRTFTATRQNQITTRKTYLQEKGLGDEFCKFLEILLDMDNPEFWAETRDTIYKRLANHKIFDV